MTTHILHGYRDTRTQRYWRQKFDLLGSRDVIGHVTVGSAYRQIPEIRCSVAEIYSCENTQL